MDARHTASSEVLVGDDRLWQVDWDAYLWGLNISARVSSDLPVDHSRRSRRSAFDCRPVLRDIMLQVGRSLLSRSVRPSSVLRRKRARGSMCLNVSPRLLSSGPSAPAPPTDLNGHGVASDSTVGASTDVADTAVSAVVGDGAGLVSSAADFLVDAQSTFSMDSSLFGWTSALALTALAVRTTSLPLLYYAQVQQVRATLASPELVRVHAYIRGAPGSLVEKYFTFRRLRSVALGAAGTSPARLFPWFAVVNVPIFVTASLAIRKIADDPPQAWKTAGPEGWFPDLAAADPTGALPIANTALWLMNAHSRGFKSPAERSASPNADGKEETSMKTEKKRVPTLFSGETTTVGLQALALFSYPFIQGVPAGMFVFWITSGLLTAAQRAALSSDAVRTAIGLPTAEQVAKAARSRGPPALQAAGSAVRDVRAQLEFVQSDVLSNFANRKPGEDLRKDVDAALRRARRRGKIGIDLEAVIRKDDETGREYIAVVRRGSSVR